MTFGSETVDDPQMFRINSLALGVINASPLGSAGTPADHSTYGRGTVRRRTLRDFAWPLFFAYLNACRAASPRSGKNGSFLFLPNRELPVDRRHRRLLK